MNHSPPDRPIRRGARFLPVWAGLAALLGMHFNVTAGSSIPTTPPAQPVPSIEETDFQNIQSFPSNLRLQMGGQAETVVVSAIDSSGLRREITEHVRLDPNEWVEWNAEGFLEAKAPGNGTITGHAFGNSFTVEVQVSPLPENNPRSFVRDILPILSRAGCNGGSCHAKPKGQNSFELSVFAYDPRADYHEIVSDARGRRLFPGLPKESLLLQKPTLTLPHKGGKRLEVGSRFYDEIVQWISEGSPYQLPEEPTLSEVQISPSDGRFPSDSSHRIRVDAVFDDGTRRDITQMAEYAVNDKELIEANEDGRIQFGSQGGEGVVLARYMGHVGQLKITIPNQLSTPESSDSTFVENNFIDALAAKHFKNLGLTPSALCTDEEFLRRAFLDAVGRLPTIDEARTFHADTAPDKRQRWIARILKDPLYGDYWANQWADLLRPNPDRVGVKSVFVLDRWLRDQFRNNTRYDQFVRGIINHRGSNHGEGPGVIYRDRRIPTEISSMFSQLFLGVRMECARCHHHPFEKWSQADFYQFAAYFGSLKQKGAGLSPPISAGTEVFYFSPGGTVKHPVSDESMMPKAPDGPVDAGEQTSDPRQRLADWLTEPDNPYFSRAIVNRIWANYFSRGFVNPVDDFRDSNPPVNEPLLDALSAHLVEQNFDLKVLMSTIMNSSLYQLSSIPNESNLRDTKHFSRFYRKRLRAETLLDAICDITQVPESFDGMPAGMRAMETWTYKIQSHFLDAFSRPNSSSDPPCERDTKSSVVQALHLMNSETLQKKLSHKDGWVAQLAQSQKPDREIVEALYLATLSRFPSDDELRVASAILSDDPDKRQGALEDLLWALINTAEFVFNH